jgi:putative ABC transport system substrate-binding protein
VRSRNIISITLSAMLFALGSSAEAQQPKNVPRIGFLSAASPSANAARLEAFRQSLGELGYVEGKNLIIEYRFAAGDLERLDLERLDQFAAEIARLNVDVIVTAAPSPTRAAKKATSTIPIVMAFDMDPVGNGFVVSLARPGGNITGLSALHPEIGGKQLEILKETVPRLSQVAVLRSPVTPGAPFLREKELELAAGALGVKLQYLDVPNTKYIETSFRAASKGRADAVLVLASPILESARTQVADLAAKNRLAAIYHVSEFVDAGGLMSYGVSFIDLYRRAPTYVDKILKGAKPAEMPVEQPTKFELVVNLKAAKQIGLEIPPAVLARADKVIR